MGGLPDPLRPWLPYPFDSTFTSGSDSNSESSSGPTGSSTSPGLAPCGPAEALLSSSGSPKRSTPATT